MEPDFLHGCHLSIAGGIGRAIDEAECLEINALQIFTHSPSVWAATAIPAELASSLRERRDAAGIRFLAVHTPYLLNLASPEPSLWRRSTSVLIEELLRADALGAEAVVTHVGAHRDAGEEVGLRRIVAALRNVLEDAAIAATNVCLLLENTAGAGTTMGRTFDELATILGELEAGDRLGVCLDSCHAHAGGYDLRDAKALDDTLSTFDRTIGLRQLRMIHLNDAKHPLGSRKDRHEQIGRGEIGEAGFAALLRHPRLRPLPFVLETPKELDDGSEADPANLATIRRLWKEARR